MSRAARIAAEALAGLGVHSLRTSLMMLGMAVAVAVLAAVMAIGAGTRERVLEAVRKHQLDMIMVRAGGDVQVFAPRADRGLSALFPEDARAIEASVPGIRLVSTVQNQRGMTVVAGDRSVVTRGFGVEPDWMTIRRWGMADGEFLSPDDLAAMARVVMLGAKVAHELFPDGGAVGSVVRVNGDPYTVKGVFIAMGASAGGDDWDDRLVVPASTSARRLFGRPHLEQIVVRVDDARQVAATAERIRELLRVRHGIPPGQPDDFFVREPEDVEDAALETSRTMGVLLVGISLVALLAGGLVIMNLMLLAVAQRTAEIGLRRAVGARTSDIVRHFLVETLAVALGGGAFGAALGIGVALALRWADLAPVHVSWPPFIAAFVACGVIGLLAGLPPARRAAAVDPATALRQRAL